jgi:UDP-2,3-diacylglucosamine hydrolase
MTASMANVILQTGKKIYFASDFHFGIPDYKTSLQREKLVCQWLDVVGADAQQIYLLGDLFDAWMEYHKVVPKGYVRFLGKLAQLTDAGVEIIVFTGNHDLWMNDYFEQELNINVFKKIQTFKVNEHTFHIGHGDGVSPLEWKYVMMKKVLHYPLCQWLYRRLHPNTGLGLADFFSRLGPKHKYEKLQMRPDAAEYQIEYANRIAKTQMIDYFVFGHRHIPLLRKINEQATFVNLGDWITFNTYAVFDGKQMRLEEHPQSF